MWKGRRYRVNELIKIETNENMEPVVSGRELHYKLGIETPYSKWFNRMCEYGFVENVDYAVTDIFVHNSNGGKQNILDHVIKIDMAKELAMIQRNEKGKVARQYFIDVERKYNSPDMIMQRALRIADERVSNLLLENKFKDQQIAELKPKADYTDRILQNKKLVTITQISKDYGMSGKALNDKLHQLGVQYKQSGQWLLYARYHNRGYTHSETIDITRSNGLDDTVMNTKWTQKGRLFLYDLLKKNGILPVIEKKDC